MHPSVFHLVPVRGLGVLVMCRPRATLQQVGRVHGRGLLPKLACTLSLCHAPAAHDTCAVPGGPIGGPPVSSSPA